MTEVNWTGIGEMISGAAVVFTSILEIVLAIVPLLIVLSVVGFIIGIFDTILDGIGGRFRRM